MVKKPNNSIRITYLVDFFRTDLAGSEKQIMILMKNLPRSHYSINLLSFQESDFLRKMNHILPDVDVTILGAQSDISKSMPSLIRLFRVLRKEKPDILHTLFPASNSFGVIVAKMAGVSHIISSRRDMGFWQTQKDLRMLRFANLCVSHVIANSFAVKENTIRSERLPKHKISVIYNALNLNEVPIASERSSKKNWPIIGIVANLNRAVKRVDLFIHAAAQIHKEYKNVKFWIVGDGPLRKDLEKDSHQI